MRVQVKPLSDQSRSLLRMQIKGVYLDGHCYAFAYTFHREFGWKMIGLINNEAAPGEEIRHVVLEKPDGGYFDARGDVAREDLGEPFNLQEPLTLREVEEHELFEHPDRHYSPTGVMARTLAAAWPDLPWKWLKDTKACLEEIAAVCASYDLWLTEVVPGQPMNLFPGEAYGFELCHLDTGATTVRRLLEGPEQ